MVLQALVDKGNTVLVIEHNMDVAKQADWLIDMGPNGGAGGGQILYAGRPEGLADADTPTAPFMADEIERAKTEGGLGLNVREIDLDTLLSDASDPDSDENEVEEDEPETEAA